MNREMRRLQEAEERRRKGQEQGQTKAQRRAAQMNKPVAPTVERKSFVRKVGQYLHEVRVELRKVTWPNREQMVVFTTLTLITSTVLTGVIFVFDMGAKQFVLWLISLGGL